MEKKCHKIIITPEGREFYCEEKQTILSAMQREGILISSLCDGTGYCGKCRVIVKKGAIMVKEDGVEDLIDRELLDKGYTLACMAVPTSDLEISIPEEAEITEVDGALIWKETGENLCNGLKQFQPFKHFKEDSLGLAVDLGTTTVVVYLFYMKGLNLIDLKAFANPQRLYGEDIISRILYVGDDRSRVDEMGRMVIEGINQAVSSISKKNCVDPEKVERIVAVGNTCMHHLFLGYNVDCLGRYPFGPVETRLQDRRNEELMYGLLADKYASIITPDIIGGFVGSDAASAVLFCGIADSADLSLIIDAGTNCEIILGNKDGIMVTSAAAGPAFEGGHISRGTRAVAGAICHMDISSSGKVSYKTIGDESPIGICGTGLVDLLAGLLKNDHIDQRGRYVGDANGFLAVDGKFSKNKRPIIISPKDIEELEKALGAVYAATRLLLEERGARPDDIKRVYIAGALGNNLNVNNAGMIGLIPAVDPSRVQLVGNAAGLGAIMFLLSPDACEQYSRIIKMCEHRSIANDPKFVNYFIDGMTFSWTIVD